MRRSTRSSTPEQLGGAGAARAEHARAVRLVDHQARSVAGAQLDDVHQRRDVALHREDTVDDHEHAAAVLSARLSARSSLSMRLWRNGRIFARESRTPSRIEAWSAESTITVSPGPSSVPSVPTFAWCPVVKTIASSVPIHSASSRSSSRCRGVVPFSRREPVSPVP